MKRRSHHHHMQTLNGSNQYTMNSLNRIPTFWISLPLSYVSSYTNSLCGSTVFITRRWDRVNKSKYCLRSSYRKLLHTRLYMGNGNSFGRCFRISTWGESHGAGVGVTIDGCPPQLPLTVDDIQKELDRRRPGQSRIVTPRKEQDEAEILSGVVDGQTIGTPIAILVRNQDQRPQDYDTVAVKYRPSHADATYDAKYGIRAVAGGGRSSARETIGRVAAGAVAKKILATYCKMEILGYVQRVKDISAQHLDPNQVTLDQIEKNMIKNVPAGLGSPVFDKLEAELAKAYSDGRTRTRTNRSGGIQGGISNGENIILRVAFKPTSTIGKIQKTVSRSGEEVELRGKGRHDPCVLPRAVPMVEAMVALVMVDQLMQQRAQSFLPFRKESITFHSLGKQL
ncbi:Chorismate synthase [Galdieria sulphuraria]|nr:Chorismate synthase [Galdieria sulphuraria]